MRLTSRPDFVPREQFVPIRAPDDLDDVPTRAVEKRFQFLDDFAVAAHRAVQPLQIAIDDPDQIVEILARAERQRTERFRLVGFAVADEAPNLRFLALDDKPRARRYRLNRA